MGKDHPGQRNETLHNNELTRPTPRNYFSQFTTIFKLFIHQYFHLAGNIGLTIRYFKNFVRITWNLVSVSNCAAGH